MIRSSRRAFLAIGIFAFLVPGSPLGSGGSAARADDGIRLPPHEVRTFPDGLRLLVLPERELPILCVRLVLRTGSDRDPEGRAGLANLTARLLREGAAGRDAASISAALDSLAADYDADVSLDRTTFTLRVLSEDAGRALALLADLVLRPDFPAAEVERMRSRIEAELASARDDPGAEADREFHAWLFGGHAYANPPRGTVAGLRAIGRDDVRAHHRLEYAPAQMILAVSGDIDSGEAARLVEAHFGGVRGGKDGDDPSREAGAVAAGRSPDRAPGPTDRAAPGPARAGEASIRIVDGPGITQPQVRIGRIGASRTSPDYPANLVASYLLGGSFSSRLVEEVRVRRGLTYRIRALVPMLREPGTAHVATFTPLDSTRAILEAVEGVVRKFLEEGPTEDEMRRASSYFTGRHALGLETADQVAMERIETELYGPAAGTVEEFPERIRRVTREEVVLAARRLFDPAGSRILVYGPAATLGPMLSGVATVEVVESSGDGP